jgi:hypothetical protein
VPVYWSIAAVTAEDDVLASKCVTVAKKLAARLAFTLPQGTHQMNLCVDCDSYTGIQHWINLGKIFVRE